MKKLLSLMMLMLLCTSAWAGEVVYKTLTFSNSTYLQGVSSYTDTWQNKVGDDTWTLENFNNNNKSWNVVKCGRNSAASIATITTDEVIDKAVTKVVVTYSAVSKSEKINSATLEVADNADFTNAQTVSMTLTDGSNYEVTCAVPTPTENCYYRLKYDCKATGANGNIAISKVEYYYYDASVITVDTPIITVSDGPYYEGEDATVTISATDGATIQYALNDGEFQAYDEPFTINTTTTVKAKAVLEVDGTTYESQEASKTITFAPAPTTAANIAAFNGLDDNTDLTFTGTVTAIAQKGNTLYVQDSEKGMLIYGDTGKEYAFGDIIPAGFKGTKTTYNGAPEMKNPTEFAAATEKAEPTPIEMTIDDITLDNFGRYGVIRGAAIEDGKIKVGDQTVIIAQTLGVAIPTEGTLFDIYGVVGWTNNPRFLPMKYVDKTPFELTITPANYIGTESVEVTIAPYHAAEGNVEITYTLDGSDPSLGEALTYNGPITITESCTLKAYALDSEMNEATAEGTYVIVVPATKFKLVTNLSELEAGKQVLIAGVDGDMYVMGAQKKDNRYAVACSLGTALTAPVATLDFTNAKVEYRSMVLGKDKDSDKYTFYDVENEGYLYAASSSNNHLKTETELDDNGKAAIDLVEGKFSVVFQGDNENKYMQFNSSSTLFSCYGPSNTQEPVYLYVEGEVVEEPIAISVSPEPGTYTEPQTIEFTVTGVPEGETATITYVIGDGDDQTYTEPFKLYKSATIIVEAKCGEKSDIKEYTYTINLPALAFKMTPAPGEYDTAQEVTIACTNAIEGCELVYDWTYTPTEGDAITGNQDNPTFTAAKTGVLRIFNVIEDNTDRGDSFDQTYNYTITEPTTTYTITLDKEPGDYTELVNVKATVEPALPEGATLTFKINDAEPKAYNPEKGVNMLESGTLTFTAKDAQGNELATTSAEYKYIMRVFGDLNGDGTVDVEEVGTVVNLILGKLNN